MHAGSPAASEAEAVRKAEGPGRVVSPEACRCCSTRRAAMPFVQARRTQRRRRRSTRNEPSPPCARPLRRDIGTSAPGRPIPSWAPPARTRPIRPCWRELAKQYRTAQPAYGSGMVLETHRAQLHLFLRSILISLAKNQAGPHAPACWSRCTLASRWGCRSRQRLAAKRAEEPRGKMPTRAVGSPRPPPSPAAPTHPHEFSPSQGAMTTVPLTNRLTICLILGLLLGPAARAEPTPTTDAETPTVLRSARSGPWSAPATWEGGKVPAAGSRVLIRTGHRVVYDMMTEDAARHQRRRHAHLCQRPRHPARRWPHQDPGRRAI